MTTMDRSTETFLELPPAITDEQKPALPEWLQSARTAVDAATADTLAVADAALATTWLFRGHDTGDGVRYGLYRAAETIEAADAELEAALAGAPARPPAVIRSSAATVARWELQGRLAALDDPILDRVGKAGEWTVRETLAHVIDGQRSYGWFTRWWLRQPLGESRPARPTDEAEAASMEDLPGEAAEGQGTLPELRARLDAVLDEWALRYADLDEAALTAPATWAGMPVDIDFRLGRWASHIREHTVQLDKTLDWLVYSPTEPARIVRGIHAAWGRLESRIFPQAPARTEGAVTSILEAMADTLVREAHSVREAAEA